MSFRFSFAGLLSLLLSVVAEAQLPASAYGDFAEVGSLKISPNGQMFAYLRVQGEDTVLVVQDRAGEIKGAINTTEAKVRRVRWATDRYVIVSASETTRIGGFRGRFEYSGAFSYDLEKQSISQLLVKMRALYPGQTGLGRISGIAADGEHVFMPAFMGVRQPNMNLVKVDLASGGGIREARGRSETIDFLVNEAGEVIAREDFDNDKNRYALYAGEDADLILEREDVAIPPYSLLGMTQDEQRLVFVAAVGDDGGQDGIFYLDLEAGAEFDGPYFVELGKEIDSVLMDNNRRLFGIKYSGLFPSYKMLDPDLDADFEFVLSELKGSSVHYSSMSDDKSVIIFLVEGGPGGSGVYVQFDRSDRSISVIAPKRPAISLAKASRVETIEYQSRDGVTINGILTWPPGTDLSNRPQLPLVVMPHGGPESYDQVGFDWMAQYVASLGYVVLQPNFRGSTGFGLAYRDAGRGEWGRGIMQHDVTDGVNALVTQGWADPEKVCIAGWSYGGYSALAGGAFTPDLYKCVIAGAAPTDLRRMLGDERDRYGKNHWVVAYWEEIIGDSKEEREKLDNISPVKFAEAFQAPVLLIHGEDDLVVEIDQSRRMERALKRADRDVKFIKLRDEDHWLSRRETRQQALEEMGKFLKEHLG